MINEILQTGRLIAFAFCIFSMQMQTDLGNVGKQLLSKPVSVYSSYTYDGELVMKMQ